MTKVNIETFTGNDAKNLCNAFLNDLAEGQFIRVEHGFDTNTNLIFYTVTFFSN